MRAIPDSIIPVSINTWQWLKQGKPRGLGLKYKLTYGWNAYWFNINESLQRRSLLQKKRENLVDPVFVLGLWRSGTTMAHELLSCCPTLTAATTRQCMNASTFAMWHSSHGHSIVLRPMDAMKIKADSPQEDEFALLALGVPTVYRAFLDPSRLSELEELFSADYWLNEAPKEWADDFKNFLHLVMLQSSSGHRLVIKSPGHSFRIKSIDQLFPDAGYLWITRSPKELFYSNRKMWRAMFKRYGLSEYSAEKLDQFLLKAFVEAANCLDWLCQQVAPEKLVVVDFSSFIEDPVNIMSAAASRLGLGQEVELRRAFEPILNSYLDYRREEYSFQQLSAEMEQIFKTLDNSQRRGLVSHGVELK